MIKLIDNWYKLLYTLVIIFKLCKLYENFKLLFIYFIEKFVRIGYILYLKYDDYLLTGRQGSVVYAQNILKYY